MKRGALFIPTAQLSTFTDACSVHSLKVDTLSTGATQTYVEIYASNGKELSPEAIFNTGRHYEATILGKLMAETEAM